MTFTLSNRTARWLWLDSQGLSETPTGSLDLLDMITRLGFVQLDTIQVLARAHHHILWSRNQNYSEPMLNDLMRRERGIFEHYTHDASVIPMAFLPYWDRQFRRKKAYFDKAKWFRTMLDASGRQAIKDRIAVEGPLSTYAFDSKVTGEKKMWARPPHKLALDYMWYCGDLATCHRDGITKIYDLGENVFPHDLRIQHVPDEAQIDWLCDNALDRLGFGSLGDVQRFWEATDAREVKAWGGRRELVQATLDTADGQAVDVVAVSDLEKRIEDVPQPTSRLRIVNPFDPVVRDRNRLKALFGFDYRIEIFVPAVKRKWGYYVYPLLEGDRFVGRIEAKADRKAGTITIINLWAEAGVKWTKARQGKLEAELSRMGRFTGCRDLVWACKPPIAC
ncbi:winged helix-turn-helix domain-containing protein [Cochlodiniinecator piscidefendens]|uniref:winged helix-turn-helix domain-containing protein n=1 Tax=Cochlodiniinecator piscidefendens TaxID=2715756 RepID=UPI00140DD255|nr:crosslink repair DNA glycosylase YcaQ family protein [Cochlodiniinecator piscidefendens]